MEISFETFGSNTNLVCKVSSSETLDTVVLGMLTNNRIKGLAQTVFSQFDDVRALKYNVTAKVSAKTVLAGTVTKNRVLGILSGLMSAVATSEEYTIGTSNLLIDLEYIFVDTSNNITELICLPINNLPTVDLMVFLKGILFNAQYDPHENNDYVAKLINVLNSNSAFTDIQDNITRMMQETGVPVRVGIHPVPGAPAYQQEQQSQYSPPQGAHHAAPAAQVAPTAPPQSAAQASPEQYMPIPQAPTPQAVPEQSGKKKKGAKAEKAAVDAAGADQEKPISHLYLLQHYNAENKAKYDAQKKDKKSSPKQEKPPSGKKQKEEAGSPVFMIPGQEPPRISEPQQFAQQPQPQHAAPPQPQTPQPQTPQQGFVPPPQPQQQPQYAPQHQPLPTAPPPPQSLPFTPPSGGVSQQVPQQGYPPQPPQGGAPMNFGETVFNYQGEEDADSGTVIIGHTPASQPITPLLIRKRNQERIFISKQTFRLGRDQSFSDYTIPENKHIGRCHCHIEIKGGEYFLIDDNSRNHTFVDGVMIPSSTEVKITHGQMIKLADEEFEFRLY